MKRTFPRTKIRGVLKKKKSSNRWGKNIDILIFLDYVLMLRSLAREAKNAALENKESSITASHINQVKEKVLKSCKG